MKKNLWLTFFPLWIMVNIFGWLSYNAWFILPYFGGWLLFASGLILSFLQWIVLSKYIDVDSTWIWASLIPYMMIHFMFYELNYMMDFNKWVFYPSIFAIFGLAGFLQFRVLDFYVPHARSWILITFFIGLIGIPAAVLSQKFLHLAEGTYFVVWLFFGCFYGVLTGISLTLLETVFRKKQSTQA